MSNTQLTNSFIAVGELDTSIPPSSLMLQLAVTANAIQYAVKSLSHNQLIFFGEYLLHHIESNSDLLRRLDKIYQNDDVLHLGFGKVIVGVDTDYTLSPAGFDFNTPSGDGISLKQHLPALNLDVLFTIDYALNYKLKSLFPTCAVQHLAASFLSFSLQNNEIGADLLFMHVSGSYFDLIRFQPGRHLRLMNRYAYKAHNDMLYFLLLAYEKLGLDRETTSLVLSGEIEPESAAYNLLYSYFRNVSFCKPGDELQFSKAFEGVSKHEHLNIYNLE